MNRAIFLFAILLTGCTANLRDMALAEFDLRDMASVATIRSQLGPQDSIAFANFVARHHRKATNFCGQPLIDQGGKAPKTIGEAIDLAILRDEADRLAALEAQKPKHRQQVLKDEWDSLIFARDILLDSQSRLQMEYGGKATRRPQWSSLKTKIADIDQKLLAMKPKVFGAGG